jgi:hypothetical protein
MIALTSARNSMIASRKGEREGNPPLAISRVGGDMTLFRAPRNGEGRNPSRTHLHRGGIELRINVIAPLRAPEMTQFAPTPAP